jgi:hypothetical protein
MGISSQRSGNACLYWIGLPEHTDISKEGYIGFTCMQLHRRLYAHKYAAKKDSKYPVHRAMRKYGHKNMIIKKLVVGTIDYCLEMELKLRPAPGIGWNIGIGGEAPWKGNFHTEEMRARLSVLSMGKPKSEEAKRNMSIARLGKKNSPNQRKKQSESLKKHIAKFGFSETHRANISAAKKGIATCPKMWRRAKAKKHFWLRAESLYDIHCTIESSPRKNIKAIPGVTAYELCRMRKHFRSGWNPYSDVEYQKWKVENAD